jgi:hypothetical protein
MILFKTLEAMTSNNLTTHTVTIQTPRDTVTIGASGPLSPKVIQKSNSLGRGM